MTIESMMPSNHLILCHPLSTALSLSQHQGLFQRGSSLHQIAKVLKLQLQHQSFRWIFSVNLILGLISLQWDQTKGLSSPKSKGFSKVFCSTTVWKHPFFFTQPSLCSNFHIQDYWKKTKQNIALTIWIFVSKVMSLLFNTLFRFLIAFLPRSKSLLISWLPSPSAVILESKKYSISIVLTESQSRKLIWFLSNS